MVEPDGVAQPFILSTKINTDAGFIFFYHIYDVLFCIYDAPKKCCSKRKYLFFKLII